MAAPLPQSITAAAVSVSFLLVGNGITQSWLTVPCLVTSFPQTGTPSHAERCTLLGQQWPQMHKVGNNFFRPMSILAVFGYAFGAYSSARGTMKGDWRLFTISALCHVAIVVHSAVNLQPINAKLDVIGSTQDKPDVAKLTSRWIECNKWRVAFSCVAGSVALWQAFLFGM